MWKSRYRLENEISRLKERNEELQEIVNGYRAQLNSNQPIEKCVSQDCIKCAHAVVQTYRGNGDIFPRQELIGCGKNRVCQDFKRRGG